MERWQEIDCPRDRIDCDLEDDEMVYAGEAFVCPICGEQHIANSDFIQQYESDDANSYARVVPLQTRV